MRYLLQVVAALFLAVLFSSCNNYIYRINQDNARDVIKEIRVSQIKFKKEYGRYGTLRDLIDKGYIDKKFQSGMDNGYKFQIRANISSYSATATPIEYGATAYKGTGGISIYVDETGVIREADKKGLEAGPNDHPVEEQD
jgi:hypothetical protein